MSAGRCPVHKVFGKVPNETPAMSVAPFDTKEWR
jgi:hypothetical protein